MGCTYVKEFKFGGEVKTPSREAMVKRESKVTPTMKREQLTPRSKVVAPMMCGGKVSQKR